MAVKGIKGNTDRLRLEEHIPLDTPLHVFIDASSVCNFHCQFCPHGNGEAQKIMPQMIMPVALAKKCIDDLKEFPRKIKRISFSAVGEPLANPYLPEIVSYAAQREVADCLGITTNASLLTPDMGRRLLDAGLTHFDISIYGLNSEKYREFSGHLFSFEDFIEQIAYFYSIKGQASVVIKISDAVCVSEEDRQNFYRIFSPICDKICIEHAVPFWYELTSEVKDDGLDIYGKPVTRKKICPVPFFSMAVQANGIITPCCIDWRNRLPMGNAQTQSLVSVWSGEKFRELHLNLLKKGNSGVSPCDHCHYHELVALDNIDSHCEKLLRRLEYIDAI